MMVAMSQPVGFHGDRYLLAIVDHLAASADFFVETGTNTGTTLSYFARRFPHITCLSCEVDTERAVPLARERTSDLENVTIFEEPSQAFLQRLARDYSHLFPRRGLFWLDAHGHGFEWPLKDEVRFIFERIDRGAILIDDFLVPGLETVFQHDQYGGQDCSFEYIRDAIPPGVNFRLYYPDYTERTSTHHPLCGWGLMQFGEDSHAAAFPPELRVRPA
jgi:hypothetical protein